ncbi:hypothetical protein HY604_00085 [Candidatus Peregrinibacteria bacterium]|nr:hypothetical protein [Candidatus Peregrinibacteria bacterium]
MNKYKLHLASIKKLRLYREIKKVILTKMRSNMVTCDEAEALMNKVKKDLKVLSSKSGIIEYCNMLPQLHPMFMQLKLRFDYEVGEKIDRVLSELVDKVVHKGNFDLAEKIMSEIETMYASGAITLEEIRNASPDDFDVALEKVRRKYK